MSILFNSPKCWPAKLIVLAFATNISTQLMAEKEEAEILPRKVKQMERREHSYSHDGHHHGHSPAERLQRTVRQLQEQMELMQREILGFAIAIGAGARQTIYKAAPAYDGSPLPRKRKNAPFITSPDFIVDQMVAAAKVSKDDLVYDLGCGDGRIVIASALQTGCRGVGFDIKPELVAKSAENAKRHGVTHRVTFKEQDIFTVDLSQCQVVLMYLLPRMVNDLVPQFDQMKPGSRIVSHDFWIDSVQPDRVIAVQLAGEDATRSLYVYTVPLKKDPKMERGKPPGPTETVVQPVD